MASNVRKKRNLSMDHGRPHVLLGLQTRNNVGSATHLLPVAVTIQCLNLTRLSAPRLDNRKRLGVLVTSRVVGDMIITRRPTALLPFVALMPVRGTLSFPREATPNRLLTAVWTITFIFANISDQQSIIYQPDLCQNNYIIFENTRTP